MNELVSASPVVWFAAVASLLIWMAASPASKQPRKLLLLIAVLAFEPLCDRVIHAEDKLTPLKYDYFLQAIDHSLGFTAFMAASALQGLKAPLFVAYQSLTLFMVIWYGVNLVAKGGRPRQLLWAYVILFSVCPALYLIVPAAGPRHAFRAAFPFTEQRPHIDLVALSGFPNAIPSLHIAAAFALLYFAGEVKIWRTIGAAFLTLTGLATLAFEHYVIDLVVGVAFSAFAVLAAGGRWHRAGPYFALVLTWLLTIRYATPWLVEHSWLLRACAAVTVIACAWEVLLQWGFLRAVPRPAEPGKVGLQPADVA